MIRRPPRSTLSSSSAASDVYKRQCHCSKTTTLTPVIALLLFSTRGETEKDLLLKPLRKLLELSPRKVVSSRHQYSFDQLYKYRTRCFHLTKVYPFISGVRLRNVSRPKDDGRYSSIVKT